MSRVFLILAFSMQELKMIKTPFLKATSASRSLGNLTQQSMSLSGILLTSTSRANEVLTLIDFYNIHKGPYQFLVISCLTFDLKNPGPRRPGFSLSIGKQPLWAWLELDGFAFSFDTQTSFPLYFSLAQKRHLIRLYRERFDSRVGLRRC